jgi:hypothetical protein
VRPLDERLCRRFLQGPEQRQETNIELSVATILIAFAGVFLICFMKGAFGGGFSIVGMPLLSVVMDPVTAGGLLAPLFIAMDMFALRYWKPSSRPAATDEVGEAINRVAACVAAVPWRLRPTISGRPQIAKTHPSVPCLLGPPARRQETVLQ